MGMGMLFAGALTGGAKAVGELADDAIKQRERAEVRQQSIMDRRNELLFEMKAKADMANAQDREDAMGYQTALERGKSMGDDRRFAKFREDVRASGGGEGMSEEGLRDLFNQHYNDKVVAGDARYYEPESMEKRDALQSARGSGASGKVLSGLQEEYRAASQGERQAKQDADKEAREDRRYQQQRERDALLFGQRKELQGERLASRGSGSGSSGGSEPKVRSTKTNADGEVIAVMSDGSTKPLGIQDQAFAKSVATMVAKMREDRRYRNEADEKLVEIVKQRLASSGVAKADMADEAAAPKSTPQKSTVKDNPTTKPVINALPAGAKKIGTSNGRDVYELPDGRKVISK